MCSYRFQFSILLALSLTATIASAQTPASKFQIRVEAKKNEKDQEVSPATLQQIRARQLAAQQQQHQTSSEYYSDEEEDDENVPVQTFHRPTQAPQRQYHQQQQHHQQQSQPQRKQPLTKKQREQLEQELEEEEPDHLAILLEKSTFSCNERTTGYYADDTVDCQVFHYCQDNTKHSWICPEGILYIHSSFIYLSCPHLLCLCG